MGKCSQVWYMALLRNVSNSYVCENHDQRREGWAPAWQQKRWGNPVVVTSGFRVRYAIEKVISVLRFEIESRRDFFCITRMTRVTMMKTFLLIFSPYFLALRRARSYLLFCLDVSAASGRWMISWGSFVSAVSNCMLKTESLKHPPR